MRDRQTGVFDHRPTTGGGEAEERLRFLQEASRRLLKTERPRKLVGELFSDLRDLMSVDTYVNYVVRDTPGGPRLRLDSCAGIPAEVGSSLTWMNFGSAVSGTVARQRVRIVVEDVLDRDDVMTLVVRQLGLRAYVCHPLIVDDHLCGTLGFGTRTRSRFSADELALLTSLSELVAVAIHRVDLQEQEARVRGELELRELHLRALAAFQPECVKVMDTEGTILEMNRAGLEMLSARHDQVVGRSIFDFVVETSESRVRRALDIAGRGRETKLDFQIEVLGGARVDVHSTLVPLRRADAGRPLVMAVTMDLTRQRQARQAFQDIDAHFRTMVEKLSEVVAVVGADGTIHYVGPSIEDVLGYPQADLTGSNLSAYVHPDDVGLLKAKFARRLAGDEMPGYSELRLAHRNGTWRLLEARATTFREYPPELIITARDVTEARTREIHYRALFESIDAGFCIIEVLFDDDGRPSDYRFLEVNPAFEQQTGLEDPVGRRVRDVLPDNDAHWYETYGRVAMTGEPEHSIEHAAPLGRWYEVHAFRVGSPEQRRVAILFNDITVRRELEEQLRQSQKLEAIGRLAAGVAHDFNNLLTSIDGHASLLLQEVTEGSDAAADATEILKATDRAADLTRKLLAFGRKQVTDERDLALDEVVGDMESMLRRLVPETITLSVEVASPRAVVRADRSQLQQVVLNLVTNAVHATSGGGAITVRVDRTELGAREAESLPWNVPPGWYGQILVHDSGEGIPEETLPHIFEPFFTSKEEGRGTGLGLASVYGTVKQASGHVLVESRRGSGTTFRVLLPLRDAHPEPIPSPVRRLPRHRGGRVLLVEDDPGVRSVTERLLKRAGFEVEVAANGTEARRLADATRHPIDVVISDVVMPHGGGIDLLKWFADRAATPVYILTSGYSDAIVRAEIRELGATFLAKPYTPESLLECVSEAADLANARKA